MRFGLDVHCLLIFYALSQIFDFSDAQISSFSPLIPSNAPQAIGSDVDITTTVTTTLPTGSLVSILWEFSDEVVGAVSINSTGGTSATLNPGSIYASRIDISVGIFASDQFTITLTIRELLASEDGSTVSISYIDLLNASLQLNIKECPSSLPYGVVITSSSRPYRYQATGMFSCPTGDLFYSNGTALPSSDTTCLANAEWSVQDNLQCWSAPDVMLNGDLNVIELDDITLTCDYDVTVIPSGTSSIFYFDNVGYTLKKEDSFTLQLQREDNMKPISCQAITPYTEIYNNTGRSLTETVNVLYGPTYATSHTFALKYFVKIGDDEYLLRSDENLTLFCSSDANPAASCIWTVCGKSCENISSAHTSDCNMDYHLSTNSSISCTATNDYGFASSKMQKVTVVPLTRPVLFGNKQDEISMVANTVTSQTGSNITLSCSISYEDELATEFEIILPNGTIVKQPMLEVVSLTTADAGNYTCVTNDLFGSFEASVYVDVQYAPYQATSTSCTWVIEETGFCVIIFKSNPGMEFVSLDINEQPALNDGANDVVSNGDKQQYIFTKTKVTSSDEGTYNLILSSLLPPYNYLIEFDVTVVNIDQLPTPDNTGAIVSGAVAAVALICITVVLALYVTRRQQTPKAKDRLNTSHNTKPHSVHEEYVEFDEHVQSNENTQETNATYENLEKLEEDKNGYLEVNVGDRQTTAANYENTRGEQNYEIIEGLYDGEI
ncbi:uncharacterized protein LOC143446309 [Clavelina lepadiformis]|uniref:uncharacterized protein LOC143446309 n=1 Tax=Clavelina lepadiformis TaxID=159417 RepID=UPI0040436732